MFGHGRRKAVGQVGRSTQRPEALVEWDDRRAQDGIVPNAEPGEVAADGTFGRLSHVEAEFQGERTPESKEPQGTVDAHDGGAHVVSVHPH